MTDRDGLTPVPQRDDDSDHDLLTYGEVGVRLYEEIAAQRQRIIDLERRAAGQELEAARTRLDALEGAAERNRRQPINEENFEDFFGYKGSPRRNT